MPLHLHLHVKDGGVTIMSDDQQPQTNTYNTATIAAMVASLFAVLDPFLHGAGVWIQHHSAIVFTDDYMGVLQHFVEVIAITYAVHRHASTK